MVVVVVGGAAAAVVVVVVVAVVVVVVEAAVLRFCGSRSSSSSSSCCCSGSSSSSSSISRPHRRINGSRRGSGLTHKGIVGRNLLPSRVLGRRVRCTMQKFVPVSGFAHTPHEELPVAISKPKSCKT